MEMGVESGRGSGKRGCRGAEVKRRKCIEVH